MDKCNCYHEEYNRPECWGTKEREMCSCGGDETKCNFYPAKRAAAQAKKVVTKNNTLRIVYVLDSEEGCVELKVLADSVEQRNGWVFAVWHNQIIGGVKEEHLKAFYLEINN